MRWLLGLLAAFCTLLVVASADAVHVLTKANFDDFITQRSTLVAFAAPWCGHCKQLAPEYEAAAVELQKRNVSVSLAKVDATEETDLAEKYGVQGYPTIFLFRDGQPEPYSGGRTQQSIVDWVETMIGPAVEWLDSSQDAAKIQQSLRIDEATDRAAFFGTFPSKEHEAATLFEAVANVSRTRGKFYAIIDSTVKTPQIVAQRSGEDPTSSTTAFQSKDRLTAWVHTESFHLLGEVKAENYAAFAARSPNWLWFVGKHEDFEKFAPTIRRVSRNYRTDLNFVWLNSDTHKAHAEGGLGMTTFPGVAVAWDGANYHYTNEITEKGLTKFIEAVKGGKVARFVKSEAVPEKNDEDVKVIVGKTFSEMVLQKDKDVFLMVHAPWCGHCQKLKPTWEELAKKAKKSKNLIIAKFDGTANEPDVKGFEYEGFPMLFFVPAGAKTPIKYDGNRELENLIEFVEKHAKYPVVIDKEESINEEL